MMHAEQPRQGDCRHIFRMAQQQHALIVDNAPRFGNLASTKPVNQIYPAETHRGRAEMVRANNPQACRNVYSWSRPTMELVEM